MRPVGTPVHATCVLFVGLAAVPAMGQQSDATWNNGAGGNWSDNANWDFVPVPPGSPFPDNGNGGFDYRVFLDDSPAPAGAYTVVLDVASVTLDELNVDGVRPTLDLQSNTINLTNATAGGTGDLLLDRGMITGGGMVNVPGTGVFRSSMLMNGTIVSLTGDLVIDRSPFSSDANDFCDVCVDFGGSGTGTWQGTADLILGGTAELLIGADATFNIENDQSLLGDGGGQAGTIENSGVIRKQVGAGTTTFQDIAMTNALDARLEVGTGTLEILGADSTVDNQGTARVDAGSSLEVRAGATLANFNGGTNTLAGGSFDVAGTLRFDGAVVERLEADLILDGAGASVRDSANGDADALGGVLEIDAGGALTLRDTHVFTAGGDISVGGAGLLRLEDTTMFVVPDGVALTNLANGSLNDGVFEIANEARLEVFDGVVDRIAGDITLDGPDAAFVDQNGASVFAGLDTVAAAGSFTVTGGQQITLAGALDQVGNTTVGPPSGLRVDSKINVLGQMNHFRGTVRVEEGFLEVLTGVGAGDYIFDRGNVEVVDGDIIVAGEFRQNGGMITLDGGEITTLGGFVQAGGSLAGNGTIDGTAVINGNLTPGMSPGAITITGATQMLPETKYIAEIGVDGALALVSDVIEVLGALHVEGGTLRVKLLAGYDPEPGDAFAVLNSAALTGGFDAIQGTVLPGGMRIEPIQTATGLSLVVTPSPSTLAPLVGLSLLASRRRR